MIKLQLGNNNSNWGCHDSNLRILTFQLIIMLLFVNFESLVYDPFPQKKITLWTCQNSCTSCFDDANQQLYYILVIKTLSLTWKSNAKRILYAHCHHSKTVNFWAQLASLILPWNFWPRSSFAIAVLQVTFRRDLLYFWFCPLGGVVIKLSIVIVWLLSVSASDLVGVRASGHVGVR